MPLRLTLELRWRPGGMQEHQGVAHPYKPFPTADLEAAVAAVPLEEHPWRERRLLKFGRDLLFRCVRAGGSSVSM